MAVDEGFALIPVIVMNGFEDFITPENWKPITTQLSPANNNTIFSM